MGRHFLEKLDGMDDYLITYGKHRGEKLSTALKEDTRYFADFVLVQFPDEYCVIIEKMAEEDGVEL